jgi:hypothetical protein
MHTGDFGIIMIRHVNNETSNEYWKECYKNIRDHYDHSNIPILIIDDNSKREFIKYDFQLENCIVLENHDYPGRAEMLPYYYLYKLKIFKKALIIHDSTFIKKKINFDDVNDILFLWHFHHEWDNPIGEQNLIKKLNNNDELLNTFRNKNSWVGCFGSQCFIELDFLEKIQEKYDIFKLLDFIKTRSDRMCFERILAVISFTEKPNLKESLFGYIFGCINSNYSWNDYFNRINIHFVNKGEFIKIFSGR